MHHGGGSPSPTFRARVRPWDLVGAQWILSEWMAIQMRRCAEAPGCRSQKWAHSTSSAPAVTGAGPPPVAAGWEQHFWSPCLKKVRITSLTIHQSMWSLFFLGRLTFKDADFFFYDDFFLKRIQIYYFRHCRFQHFSGRQTEKEKAKSVSPASFKKFVSEQIPSKQHLTAS